MALGTGSISLVDVRIEVGLGATASLQDCFTASKDAGFNLTYKGNKDRLSNFKGYNHSVLTSFNRGTSVGTQSSDVCGNSAAFQVWHNGAGALPVADDIIYTNASGTITYVGGFGHWIPVSVTESVEANDTCLVNGVGVVILTGSCNLQP